MAAGENLHWIIIRPALAFYISRLSSQRIWLKMASQFTFQSHNDRALTPLSLLWFRSMKQAHMSDFLNKNLRIRLPMCKGLLKSILFACNILLSCVSKTFFTLDALPHPFWGGWCSSHCLASIWLGRHRWPANWAYHYGNKDPFLMFYTLPQSPGEKVEPILEQKTFFKNSFILRKHNLVSCFSL